MQAGMNIEFTELTLKPWDVRRNW